MISTDDALADSGMKLARGISFNTVFLGKVFPEYRGPSSDWVASVDLQHGSVSMGKNATLVEENVPFLLKTKVYRVLETSSGCLGLMLQRTMPGDIICVLKYCKVLVALRNEGDQRF